MFRIALGSNTNRPSTLDSGGAVLVQAVMPVDGYSVITDLMTSSSRASYMS